MGYVSKPNWRGRNRLGQAQAARRTALASGIMAGCDMGTGCTMG